MPDTFLGLDLSDALARIVIVDAAAKVRSRGELPNTGAGLASGLREAVRRTVADAGGPVKAVAVALPQAGEAPAAEVMAALADAVPNASAPQVVAAGTASAIAEHWCGAARGLSHVITCALGEHITAGLILNGAAWRGAHGLAGAVGWLALNPVEREDYRRYGGLEAEVAAAGIVRRLIWRIKSGDRSAVADRAGGDLSRVTADDILQSARAGDGVCISVVRDTAKYVGMAVANLATMIDPEAVILGGMLATSGDLMLEAIRVECGRRLRPAQAEHISILLSTLGPDAAAIGAARAGAQRRA